MVFRNIIKEDIEEHFYISEISDDKSQVVTINYLDIINDYTLEEIENQKKNVIRNIRLGKIIGRESEDISEIIDIIKEIKDPKILMGEEYKDMGSSPTLRTFQIFLTEKEVITSPLSSDFNYNKDIYTQIYNKINLIIEEVLVNEYLKLSYINDVKNKHFFGKDPIICDNDPTIILSKINLACNAIQYNNRKELGNMLIINPTLYKRYKSYFLKLNLQIFLSKFIDINKILVTLNSSGVEFFRLIYSFKEAEIIDPSFERSKKFRLDYGYEKTSISAEDNCVLIDIKD